MIVRRPFVLFTGCSIPVALSQIKLRLMLGNLSEGDSYQSGLIDYYNSTEFNCHWMLHTCGLVPDEDKFSFWSCIEQWLNPH